MPASAGRRDDRPLTGRHPELRTHQQGEHRAERDVPARGLLRRVSRTTRPRRSRPLPSTPWPGPLSSTSSLKLARRGIGNLGRMILFPTTDGAGSPGGVITSRLIPRQSVTAYSITSRLGNVSVTGRLIPAAATAVSAGVPDADQDERRVGNLLLVNQDCPRDPSPFPRPPPPGRHPGPRSAAPPGVPASAAGQSGCPAESRQLIRRQRGTDTASQAAATTMIRAR